MVPKAKECHVVFENQGDAQCQTDPTVSNQVHPASVLAKSFRNAAIANLEDPQSPSVSPHALEIGDGVQETLGPEETTQVGDHDVTTEDSPTVTLRTVIAVVHSNPEVIQSEMVGETVDGMVDMVAQNGDRLVTRLARPGSQVQSAVTETIAPLVAEMGNGAIAPSVVGMEAVTGMGGVTGMTDVAEKIGEMSDRAFHGLVLLRRLNTTPMCRPGLQPRHPMIGLPMTWFMANTLCCQP